MNTIVDKNFINKDISQISINQLKQRNKLNKKREVKPLSNLHIQQIVRNRYFNIKFYKSHYDDVKDMSQRDIINHYILFGNKEGRIVSKKHAAILTNNPEFDIDFYKSHHTDLHNASPAQLVTHYIQFGKKECRIVTSPSTTIVRNSSTSILNNVPKLDNSCIKICIIYVYYERKNEQKNQTNLAFFIKYGLDKSRWKNMDITTLLMINGNQCELQIPLMENVHVLYNNNEYDVISQKTGIQYFENKYNTPFYNSFTHLLIMNCGVIGPIYEEGLDRHWLDPYLSKLTNNTVLCSPCINFLKKGDMGGPGPRAQSYLSLIQMNKHIYDLLLNTKISNLAPDTTNHSVPLEYDYVFGSKNNLINTILIGEYGITRILLDNGYNISCLIYDNIDYNDQTIWDSYSDRIDRVPDITMQHFNKQEFIKNYWRKYNTERDSLPCFYNESIAYVYNKFNYNNIFDEYPSIEYNYDCININSVSDKTKDSSLGWKNKKQFYKLFGHAEEHIIWPQQKTNNTACVIYCHYDKDNLILDYVIQALKTLIILEYDIFFCTTSCEIINVDLPFEIHYLTNDGPGADFKMCNHIFNTKKLSKYLWITMLNDSIMLPIHGIENMKNTILRMRETNDFWGLYESNEINIHLCSNCFVEISINCLNTLHTFYNDHISTCYTKQNYIDNLEIIQTQHLVNHGFTYDAVVSYKYLAPCDYCILFHPNNINTYLVNKDCFGIKWKYLGNYIKYNEVNNPYLNYLMRYVKLSEDNIPYIPNHF